jgi:phosphomannomutase
VEAGLARMNRLTVIKVSHGLGMHLLGDAEAGARERGVVVAFDGRHSSRQFAEDAASVLAGLGIPVHLFPDPVPTPLAAFAVPRLGACAGVMVTASHNPPHDNGYKVYRADGGQILPPVDGEIAARLAAAPPLPAIPRLSPPDAALAGRRRLVEDRVEAAYLDGLAAAAFHAPDGTPLRVVYTALHGVGHRIAIRAFRRAGFEGVVSVPAQSDPDGSFRTVAFPNPEEKGAMDRALALAEETGAELVLANDPDADRLGAAVLDAAERRYRRLSGNEIGVLLADDALDHAETGGRRKLVVTTLVSSTLLSRMARDRGAAYAETLTGFKWIAEAARGGAADGLAYVFGYEEALGYGVGPLVLDKDGIGAALRLAERARHLKAQGRTLLERLDELLIAHGMSHQLQWSVSRPEPGGRERLAQAMAALRADPPAAIGASPVLSSLDTAAGVERGRDGTQRPSPLPASDVLALWAEDGTRLIARPSGTEPKLKFYLELSTRVSRRDEVAPARARLEAAGTRIKAALLERLGLA